MVVIRRELPRTKSAGRAVKAGRIGGVEDSPAPCAIPAADHLCLCRVHGICRGASGGALELLCSLRTLELNANRPDEAAQLSAYGGNNLLLFASGPAFEARGAC